MTLLTTTKVSTNRQRELGFVNNKPCFGSNPTSAPPRRTSWQEICANRPFTGTDRVQIIDGVKNMDKNAELVARYLQLILFGDYSLE